MDAVISQIQDSFEGEIDFEGQRVSEMICNWLLSITATIALALGFFRQDIYLTMWTGLGGTVLTMLAVVPPWPAYNKHPQPWIGSKSQIGGLPTGGIVVDGRKVR